MLMLAGATPVLADDNADWKKEREVRFAAVKASHPPQDAVIAEIRAKTAVLIAAYKPPPGPALDRAPVVWRTHATPIVVFDIAVAPRMVVVPAGEFTMGAPKTERGHRPDETPRRRVHFARAVAISMFPITYGEYAYFVGATGHRSATGCVAPASARMTAESNRGWQTPGFAQTRRSPATCIGFGDAVAYAAWLSKETGQRYRLLSEAEYEFANRAGTSTAFWWGDDRSKGCTLVNGIDSLDCHDGFEFTTPLDQSKPNPFGLMTQRAMSHRGPPIAGAQVTLALALPAHRASSAVAHGRARPPTCARPHERVARLVKRAPTAGSASPATFNAIPISPFQQGCAPGCWRRDGQDP